MQVLMIQNRHHVSGVPAILTHYSTIIRYLIGGRTQNSMFKSKTTDELHCVIPFHY